MIDSLREHEAKADLSPVMNELKLQTRGYALLTLHRAANVDERDSFMEILEGLSELNHRSRIIFPVHPRTRKQIFELGLQKYFDDASGNGIEMIDPQGYINFLCLMKHARLVVTDSGGVQEETTALGVPCVTVRDNTERPITIECGSNVLGGTRRTGIRQAIRTQLARVQRYEAPELWDGRAASRIVGILAERMVQARGTMMSVPEAAESAARSATASGQM
jgi:UDP-N-acetylglucosamine 2-epimerase (non-hydrolysing)